MKVKLLTPWNGPLPPWIDKFCRRINSSDGLFNWAPFHCDLDWLNTRASEVTGLKCSKETFYAAACDFRPLYGRMFPKQFDGFDWWGWCDLDCVFGDLDRLLGPMLESYEVITTAEYVHGPMTMLRSGPQTDFLWQDTTFAEALTDPEYWNLDETGFDNPANPSMTRAVRDASLRVHWDHRTWTESHDTIEDGVPARSCRLTDDGRLIETPTERELVLYHFTSKQWPMPNRWCSSDERLAELQRNRIELRRSEPLAALKGEESPEFWARRIRKVDGGSHPLHMTVIDTPIGDWEKIQHRTAEALRAVKDGDRVLDAGCGYGALIDCLTAIGRTVDYVGVDRCPEMVKLARREHPDARFRTADVAALPFEDDAFDWAVCRGLEGTAKTLVSNRAWVAMRREMLRVARRLMLVDTQGKYRIVERSEQ